MNETERAAQLRQHLARRISEVLASGRDLALDVLEVADKSSEAAIDQAVAIAAAEAAHRAQLAQWQQAQQAQLPPPPNPLVQQVPPQPQVGPQPTQFGPSDFAQVGPSDFAQVPSGPHGAPRMMAGTADLASQEAAAISAWSQAVRSGDRSAATQENRQAALAAVGAVQQPETFSEQVSQMTTEQAVRSGHWAANRGRVLDAIRSHGKGVPAPTGGFATSPRASSMPPTRPSTLIHPQGLPTTPQQRDAMAAVLATRRGRGNN